MDNRSSEIRISQHSIIQGMFAESCFHIIFHCETKDTRIKAVEDGRNIELSILSLDLSYVGNIFFERFVRTKISFEEIIRCSRLPICFGNTIGLSLRADH